MLIAFPQEVALVISCYSACSPAPKRFQAIEGNEKEMLNAIILRYFPAKIGRKIQILLLDRKKI